LTDKGDIINYSFSLEGYYFNSKFGFEYIGEDDIRGNLYPIIKDYLIFHNDLPEINHLLLNIEGNEYIHKYVLEYSHNLFPQFNIDPPNEMSLL
jgi:hypothetical protein